MDALRSLHFDIEYVANNSPLEDANKGMDDLVKKHSTLEKEAKQAGESAAKSLKNTGDEAKKAGDNAGKLNNKLSDTVKNTNNLEKGMSGLNKSIAGLLTIQGLKMVAGTMMDLADGYANVEYVGAKINTLAKTDLSKIVKGMGELSTEFGIQKELIGEAEYAALSAGRTYEQLFEGDNFMRNALKISEAGFVDPLGSVDLVTTIMNTYKMDEGSGEIGDALLSAQNRGKITVGEMNQYYSKQFASFKALGVDYKDALGFIAEATRMGIKPAEASTGLGAMLTEFSRSDSSINEIFKEVTKDTIPEFLKKGGDIIDVIKKIRVTSDRLEMSVFDMFSSSEAARTFETMTGDAQGLLSTLDEVNNSVGILEESYNTMANTSKKNMDRMKEEWQDLKDLMGEEVAPLVTSIMAQTIDIGKGLFKGDWSLSNTKNVYLNEALDAERYASGFKLSNDEQKKDIIKKRLSSGTSDLSSDEIAKYLGDAKKKGLLYENQVKESEDEQSRGKAQKILDLNGEIIKTLEQELQKKLSIENISLVVADWRNAALLSNNSPLPNGFDKNMLLQFPALTELLRMQSQNITNNTEQSASAVTHNYITTTIHATAQGGKQLGDEVADRFVTEVIRSAPTQTTPRVRQYR